MFWNSRRLSKYGRKGRVMASEEVTAIQKIGINKCARESGFDRKNFIRKLLRGIPVSETRTMNSRAG